MMEDVRKFPPLVFAMGAAADKIGVSGKYVQLRPLRRNKPQYCRVGTKPMYFFAIDTGWQFDRSRRERKPLAKVPSVKGRLPLDPHPHVWEVLEKSDKKTRWKPGLDIRLLPGQLWGASTRVSSEDEVLRAILRKQLEPEPKSPKTPTGKDKQQEKGKPPKKSKTPSPKKLPTKEKAKKAKGKAVAKVPEEPVVDADAALVESAAAAQAQDSGNESASSPSESSSSSSESEETSEPQKAIPQPAKVLSGASYIGAGTLGNGPWWSTSSKAKTADDVITMIERRLEPMETTEERLRYVKLMRERAKTSAKSKEVRNWREVPDWLQRKEMELKALAAGRATSSVARPSADPILAQALADRDRDGFAPCHRQLPLPLKSGLKRRGTAPPGAHPPLRRRIQMDPKDVVKNPIHSYKHYSELWFSQPGSVVYCDRCEKQLPQMEGCLQKLENRSDFAQEAWLCHNCSGHGHMYWSQQAWR